MIYDDGRRLPIPVQIPICYAAFFALSSTELRMKIFIDGKYYDERDAKISVFDHGLLYGDGVF